MVAGTVCSRAAAWAEPAAARATSDEPARVLAVAVQLGHSILPRTGNILAFWLEYRTVGPVKK